MDPIGWLGWFLVMPIVMVFGVLTALSIGLRVTIKLLRYEQERIYARFRRSMASGDIDVDRLSDDVARLREIEVTGKAISDFFDKYRGRR